MTIDFGTRSIAQSSILSISFGKESGCGYGFRVAYEKPTKSFFCGTSTKVVTEFFPHSYDISAVRAAIKKLGEQIGFYRIGIDYIVNLDSVKTVCQRNAGDSLGIEYLVELEHQATPLSKRVTRSYWMSNDLKSTIRAVNEIKSRIG